MPFKLITYAHDAELCDSLGNLASKYVYVVVVAVARAVAIVVAAIAIAIIIVLVKVIVVHDEPQGIA